MRDIVQRLTRFTGAIAAALALAGAQPAAARAGNGIRLGGSEGRLHPFLELETRYDSNVLYAGPAAAVGDVILHVRPGLVLSAPGDVTALDLRAALDWAQHLGLEDDTTELSRLYGEAALGIGVNRRGVLGLEIGDTFRRNAASQALSLGAAVIANYNALRVAIPWRPGGGALALTVGGEWQLETFEPYLDGELCDRRTGTLECDSALLDELGYDELRATGELRWKFLPRTAIVVDGGYFDRIPKDADRSADVTGYRATAGIAGLVTPRLAATLKAGYGETLSVGRTLPQGGLGTPLANVELEWLADEAASTRLGYVRDLGVDPGSILALFTSDRVYLDGRVVLGGRMGLRLAGHLERRAYEGGDEPVATLLRIEPSIEAYAGRWLRASIGYAFTDRDSDLPPGSPALPGFDYTKNEVWLRTAVTY